MHLKYFFYFQGTVFATGTVLEGGFFEYVLKKHGCAYKGARNIAIAGSTAAQVLLP